MKHKLVRFLAALVGVAFIATIATSLSSTAQASGGSDLGRARPSDLPANPSQPSSSRTLTDDLERYSFSVPSNWKVTTDKHWDNAEVLKFDALVGLTAPDGEVVSMRMWEDVPTSLEASSELYLRPFLAPATIVNEGTLRGNTIFIALEEGVSEQSPSSVFAFIQCHDLAFRFEYISLAGGSQMGEFANVLESFQCAGNQLDLSDEAAQTVLPSISGEDLIAAPTSPQADSCVGYWDPNGNRFGCGECTWWASYSRPDIPNSYDEWHGDAERWDDNAREHPRFDVVSAPELGAIAVWEANSGGTGAEGHVAYVTWVNGDGTFQVTEMNWDNLPNPQPPTTRSVTDTANINFIIGGVTFFEHVNFEGEWYRLRANEPDLTFGGLNPSSIFIPAGWDRVCPELCVNTFLN